MSLRVHYEILNQKGTPAFYSDIFANRPAFGFAGRVFISTDTGEIFEDTGSSWTLIADAGAGTTGTLQQVTTNGNTTNQGIVITAGNLGINTSSPGAPLDIHGTGTNAQFNGTGTNNAYVLFQNAGANKWRLGNNYNAGQNSFDFYSYNAAGVAASLNGNGSLLLNFNLGIKQTSSINLVSGYSNIAADSGGFFFNIGGANNAYLNFAGLTASRTFTFPDTGGTLALTSQIPAASQWTTSGNNIYYNTGNVGIGTSTPGYDGSGYGAITYLTQYNASGTSHELASNSTANDAFIGSIDFINTANSGGSGSGRYGIANIRAWTTNAGATNTGGGYLTFSTKADTGTQSVRMTITSAGVIGIGTSSPRLAGTGYSGIEISSTTNGASILLSNSTNNVTYIYTGTSGGDLLIENSGAQIFRAGSAERMRITSGGQVLVGATASLYPNVKLSVKQTSANIPAEIWSSYASDSGSAALMLIKNDNVSSSSQVFQRFVIDNGNTANGQINGNGASQVAFGSWSDIRLKENITNLSSQLQNILMLRPCEFDYKNGSGHQIGFIAQELKEIYPDAISEDKNGYLMVTGWNKTEAILVKAIQELHEKLVRNNIN